MDIIWHGHSCFELVSGGYSAVIDPFQDTSAGRMRGQWPHACFTVSVTFIFIVVVSLSAVPVR